MFLELSKTNEIVTLGQAGSTVILAARLSFVIFVLREEFAFMFQTFSRNDPPGKAPPSRGRSVFFLIDLLFANVVQKSPIFMKKSGISDFQKCLPQSTYRRSEANPRILFSKIERPRVGGACPGGSFLEKV